MQRGAVPCQSAVVTAADRAAATCQRLSPIQVYKRGPEGVAGAIGKLPDGLRPPPRLRRGEIPPPQTRSPQKAPSAEGAVSRKAD